MTNQKLNHIRELVRFALAAARVPHIRSRGHSYLVISHEAYADDVAAAKPVIPVNLENTLVEYLVETDPGDSAEPVEAEPCNRLLFASWQ